MKKTVKAWAILEPQKKLVVNRKHLTPIIVFLNRSVAHGEAKMRYQKVVPCTITYEL